MISEKKEIFAITPLSKKMEGGKALYGVQLRLNGLDRTQEVWKQLSEYCALQRQISTIAFDFDAILQKQISKATQDQQKLQLIANFINSIKSRPDITSLITFKQFFNLTDIQSQYLSQWNQVNVGIKDMTIIGIAWNASTNMLISLHKPKSKVTSITNFFKQLLHKDAINGLVRIHRLTKKWSLVTEFKLQSEPIRLQWSNKSRILFISTHIGVYVYTINQQGQNMKHQLIDFVKIFDSRDFKYGHKMGNLFILGSDQIYLHSINKQFTMEISAQKFNNLTSMDLNKNQNRMYCAQLQKLKIFDISDVKNIKQVANIPINDQFCKLICYEEKFLFALSKAGYLSVFQIKSQGKQRLTQVLTSIDCPSNSNLFAFHEKNQMMICSNGQYIVLISTKNVPLFAGGTHRQPITSGIYDNQSNLIITADEEGNVIFSNITFRNPQ